MREVNPPKTGSYLQREELGAIYERLMRLDVRMCTEADLAGETSIYVDALTANTRTIREAMLQ